MAPRPLYLLITVGAVLSGLGSAFTLLGGSLDESLVWRVAPAAVLIGSAVLAVASYRKWKHASVRE